MPRKLKPAPTLFDRRTLSVLGCLIASMTVVSGLLLVLEPGPLAPIGGPILTVLEPNPRGIESLFAARPAPDPDRWQAIVIHHTGRSYGNAQTLAERDQALGRGGLGYHFVIGNGDGAGDGEIQVGYRWARQLDGRHVGGRGPAADWYNRHAIGICLIGDGDDRPPTASQMRQLVRLASALQQRLGIPPRRVLLHAEIARTTSPGRLFPAADFRRRLPPVR